MKKPSVIFFLSPFRNYRWIVLAEKCDDNSDWQLQSYRQITIQHSSVLSLSDGWSFLMKYGHYPTWDVITNTLTSLYAKYNFTWVHSWLNFPAKYGTLEFYFGLTWRCLVQGLYIEEHFHVGLCWLCWVPVLLLLLPSHTAIKQISVSENI